MPEIRNSDGSLRRGETLRSPDLPALSLRGIDLTFIRIDHQARLQFGQTEIVIETPFSIDVGGEERTLDPGRREDLGLLLAIYPATLASAAIKSDLTLRLSFENGVTLTVPPHPQYESWHVVGPGSRLIVCPPTSDGTLAVWR